MNFSSILDISSFFIGIIINLLFVALMCYYFKSKYDNLELAQNEQAKAIYDLTHNQRCCLVEQDPMRMTVIHPKPCIRICEEPESDSDSDSDSDSETDSGTEPDMESEHETKTVIIVNKVDVEEVNEIIQDVSFIVTKMDEEKEDDVTQDVSFIVTKMDEEKEDDYGKLTMKQLKELLSSKGIKTKPNMRKEELIELMYKKTGDVSGSPMFGSFSSENIEIDGMEEIAT